MFKESDIIKNIKYEIVEGYYKYGQILDIDNVLALIATVVFPLIKKIEYQNPKFLNNKGKSIDLLEKYLISFSEIIKRKKGIRDLSKDALYRLFLELWIPMLNQVDKLALCDTISLIELDKSLLLVENPLIFEKIKEIGPAKGVNISYGNETFNIEQFQNKKITPKSGIPKSNSSIDYSRLNSIWKEIYSVDYEDSMPMVWKLKLSNRTYRELKEALSDISKENNNSITKIDLSIHAQKIFVFVAEWYRREYEGQNTSALRVIFKDNISAQAIWDECPEKWKKFLYQSSSNTSWLHSMYVLGGLPLKYKSTNLKQFYKNIFNIKNGVLRYDNEIDSENEFFNNSAIRESLAKGGSLFEFVNEIINNNFPFSDEDSEEADIQKFITDLKEGGKRKKLEKFKLEWILEYEKSASLINRSLKISMNPELDGDYHNYISYERLEELNLAKLKSVPKFNIAIRFNENDIKNILQFSNNYQNNFVAWTTSPYVNLLSNDIPTTSIEFIEILINNENEYYTVQEFNILPYMQLYKTDKMFEWSSIPPKAKDKFSAIIYPNTYSIANPIQENNQLNKKFSNCPNADIYGWYEFKDECTLLLPKNEKEIFYCKSKYIEISPKLYNNIIEYNEGNTLSVYLEGTEKFIPVVFGYNGFVIYSIDKDKEKIDKTECNIEFNQGENTRYQLWNAETTPDLGLCTIRIRLTDMSEAKLEVFFIPCEANPIKRDLKKNIISFDKGITNIYHNKTGDPINGVNEYEDNPNTSKNEHIVSFKIVSLKDPKSYVILPIYRPRYLKHYLVNDKVVKEFDSRSDKFVLALICKENVHLRIVDENGTAYHNVEESGFCYFEEEVDWKASAISNHKQEGTHFRYIVCHTNGSKEYIYPVSKEYKNEYIFYKWDFKSDPVIVDSDYNEIEEQLVLKIMDLKENEIVFQSLVGNRKPLRYWEPIVKKSHELFKPKGDLSLLDKCFKIAKKHSVYFRIFQPIYNLVTNDGGMQDHLLMDFFLEYAQNKEYKLGEDDYLAFHRLADEFLFDWLFLCRTLWIKRTNEGEEKQRKAVYDLFKSNPHVKKKTSEEQKAYSDIIDSYWSNDYLPNKDWKLKAHMNSGSIALCFMHRYNQSQSHKYNFTGKKRDPKTIQEFLRKLYKEEGYIQKINTQINTKLRKTIKQ